MVDVNKAVLAEFKKSGYNFEILVDCEKALQFKEGKKMSLDEVVVTKDVFKDVKKGLHASEQDMVKVFNTKDTNKVVELIIKEGYIHLNAEHKRKQLEERTKQVISLIVRNAINPQTNTPHPYERIKNALDEAKVKIDPNKNADQQVQVIVTALQRILPIKFETRKIELYIPAKYSGSSYSIIKSYVNIQKDEWKSDGSLYLLVELPAGLQDEFFNKINNLTHGEVQTKIVQ